MTPPPSLRHARSASEAAAARAGRALRVPVAGLVEPVVAAVEGAGSYAAARAAIIKAAHRPTPPTLRSILLASLTASYAAGERSAADG